MPLSAESRLAIAQPGRAPAHDDDVVALHDENQPCDFGAHVVPDVLGLAVLVETRLAELAADAGLLVAAPLRLRDVGVVVVDPDRAHPQPAGDALGPAGVLGPDRAGQPVEAVVGDPHRRVLVGEGLDGQDRAERLLAGHRHRAGAAVEHGRQVVEAAPELRVLRCRTAAAEHGALGDPGGDVRRHLVAVRGADQRPGLRLRVVRSAQPDGAGPVDQRIDEVVVDLVLHEQAGAGRADLAGVEEHRGQRIVERDLEIGVGEDDVGVLAAQLEGDLLHGGGGRRHDAPAGLHAAGERDHVHPGVLGEQRARLRPGTEDQVADAGRQPGLLEQAHQVDARVRCQLARLEHEGVTGRQARRDLPAGLQQRVVPGRDQAADAERLVDDPADHVGVAGVDDPTGVLGGGPAVVTEHRDHVGDVVPALDQALARVRGLGLRDRVGVPLEQVGGAEQEVASLTGGRRGPGSLVEGAVGGVDGERRVLGPGLVDLTGDAAVGRADDRAAASGERTHPRSVDVEVWHPATPLLRVTQPVAEFATFTALAE